MRTRRPIPRRTDNLVRHEFYISPRRDGQNCPSYELAREKRRILGSPRLRPQEGFHLIKGFRGPLNSRGQRQIRTDGIGYSQPSL